MNFYMMLYLSSFLLAMNADDWFMIWLALEVNMMVFVIMIYNRYSLKHIESCLKYFFVQSLGSGVFIGIFYLNKEMLSYFGSLLMSFKVGAGPFFFWFPSVAGGLGWISCFVLFSFQKIIPLMLLVMFMGWMMWTIIMVSLIFGVMGSLNQSHIKRLMAFSSIHHIGWLLMCNICDSSIWLMYLLMYMFVTLSVILVMNYYEIENLLGINKLKNKWWFLLNLLSLGGMPPLLGFFLKWLAFDFFLKMNYWIVIFMILMSILMFYVYIRIVYNMFMGWGVEIGWINFYQFFFSLNIESMSVIGMILGSLLGLFMFL